MAALDKINKIPVLYKIVALSIAVVATVAGFYLFEWSTIQEEVKSLETVKRQLQAKYKEQKAVADNLPVFQKSTQELERDLESALKQLPKEAEVETLLRDIYTLGMKSGIKFKVFKPEQESVKKLYAELPISLELEGTYHDIVVFFDRIGKLSRIVNISNVSAKGLSGSKDSAAKLSIKCNATTFRFVGGGGN